MSRKILNVKKIKQLEYYCVPASVAMVLNYYGVSATQEEVAQELIRGGDGFLDQSILPYVRSRGLVAHPRSRFSVGGLISLIDREILAIVRTTCLDDPSQAHLSVIKGYDSTEEVLFFNDPNNLWISRIAFERFERIWIVENENQRSSENYAISIHPK